MPFNITAIGRKLRIKASWVGAAVLACVSASTSVQADVKLPAIFGNHMVLQRDVPIKVWGWSDPGEEIRVEIGGRTANVVGDAKGKWAVTVDALPAGLARTLSVHGKNTVVAQDVLIGDVWVCSGQSNMSFALNGAKNSKEEIENARFPSLRHFEVKRSAKPEPQDDVVGEWQSCSPETVGRWSAVAYFFGRELQQETNVPIGLVHTSWGGTPAEAWVSKPAMDSIPEFKELAETQLKKWDELTKTPAPEPAKGARKNDGQGTATMLYNAMIAPISQLPIKGAIWYQGEANTGRAAAYNKLLPLLISDWRKNFAQGDFPFYIVQLANFERNAAARGTAPAADVASDWAFLRDAQWKTGLNVPNTGTAVIIDIGEGGNIHPKNKQDVGKRLALLALAKTYGQQVEFSGPVFDSMAVEGNAVRVKLSHAKGLTAKDGAPKWFALAGEDKKFVWADAKIDGESVVVSGAGVAKPVAVRYCWANNPEGANVYNEAGLPAAPFRSDDWPQ